MLRVPADTDGSLLRVPAKVQTLLQIPVVVTHSPQLDCKDNQEIRGGSFRGRTMKFNASGRVHEQAHQSVTVRAHFILNVLGFELLSLLFSYGKCWLVCLPTKQLRQRSRCSTAGPSPQTHTRRETSCITQATPCCHTARLQRTFANIYPGLVFVHGEGEVSVQQAVLLHENHAVLVGMAP